MRYRYRVLHYTYPDDSETLSKLKGVLRSYTLLLSPEETSLRDALLMTTMRGEEIVIAQSGGTFLIAPSQDVPLGWTSGEEFLVSRERGLEKVAEEIVGREKGTTALKGALIAGLMLLILYTAYHYRALETVNNILLFIGVLLSILGGLLKGYKRRRVRVSAPPHHPE